MLQIQLAQIAKLGNAVTDLASKIENLSERNNDGIWAKWRNWRATRSAEKLDGILGTMIDSARFEKYPAKEIGKVLKIVGELQAKFDKMVTKGGFKRTRTFCRKDTNSNTRKVLNEVLESLHYLKDTHPEPDLEFEPEMSPSAVNAPTRLETRQPILIPVKSSDGTIAYKMSYEATSINGPQQRKQPTLKTPLLQPSAGESYSWWTPREKAAEERQKTKDRKLAQYDEYN